MRAEIYTVQACPAGRLAIMARPRAGDWLADEVAAWSQAGLAVVVSLLEAEEIVTLDLAQEAPLCSAAGIEFLPFPVPDRGIPSCEESFGELVTILSERLRVGHGVGIHCRMGIGRSSLVAACVLIELGVPAETAWESLAQARGFAVPDTAEQQDWVARWAARIRPAD